MDAVISFSAGKTSIIPFQKSTHLQRDSCWVLAESLSDRSEIVPSIKSCFYVNAV